MHSHKIMFTYMHTCMVCNMCVGYCICTWHLYGNLFVDLYSEEHAVMCSPDKQTHYADVGNAKPTNAGICNPHIPIKAPQVY